MEEDLSNNDIEFIQSRNNENLNLKIPGFEQPINVYNKIDFILENLINKLRANNIICQNISCPECGKIMKLESNSNYMDGKL